MNRIALGADLTVTGIAQNKSGLDSALGDSHSVGAIELDLAEVTAFDSAGLQLLLSLWHAAAENGRAVVLHNTPRSVAAVLEEFDVADRFKTGAGAPLMDKA
jgi:anti-sigma B factor antagonist